MTTCYYEKVIRRRVLLAILLVALAAGISLAMRGSAFAQVDLETNTRTSTVFIAGYDGTQFLGWGSGFFVDKGIVVTNKHVIEKGKEFRVYATTEGGVVDGTCYTQVWKSDIKVSLEDDVAFIRVYLDCDHGTVYFADEDPAIGSAIEVIGYPQKETFSASLNLTKTTGTVTGFSDGPWLRTNASMHFGNSGGPVVHDGWVVGVAVAKTVDREGNFLSSLFVPVSGVRRDLEREKSRDPSFVYTLQSEQDNPVYTEPEEEFEVVDPFTPLPEGEIANNRHCFNSLGEGGEATGYGGCRCKPSYHKDETGTMCVPGDGKPDAYKMLYKRISRKNAISSSSTRSMSSAATEQSAFDDVRESDPSYEAITELRDRGIIGGYPDGTFKPNRSVNRAELLKILVAGLHEGDIRGETHCFPDVADEWFAVYVCAAKRLGWVGGYPDGTFRPADTVNRAEAIKIIVSSLGGDEASRAVLPVDVAFDAWFRPFVQRAIDAGVLTSDALFAPGENLLRSVAAEWIYRGL